jgi:hypothetical protein
MSLCCLTHQTASFFARRSEGASLWTRRNLVRESGRRERRWDCERRQEAEEGGRALRKEERREEKRKKRGREEKRKKRSEKERRK